MAELRRISGEMEPHRRPAGRRVLLPSEVQLCQFVGITEDEYFYFVDIVDSYNGKRKEELAHVPDIRCDPTVVAIVQIVVGIALSVVSAVLAPKPRSPESRKPQNIRTPDVNGLSRFAPQTEFNSLQNLAALGSVIPLVFTRKGVRVDSQLLWSQMVSKKINQQLNAIFLFSLGELGLKPDFAGFAIGDSLLETYTGEKLNLYFNANGGRIKRNDEATYSEGTLTPLSGSVDVFSVYWDPTGRYEPLFSGSRTPSTQSQFGNYAPMPNGMQYRVGYEVVPVPDGAGKSVREDARTKRSKVYGETFPRRAAVTSITSQLIRYEINESTDNGQGFRPWGTEDVRSAVESARVTADSNINVGELYLAGTALAVCTNISLSQPWRIGLTKYYTFKWTEGRGSLQRAKTSDRYGAADRLLIQRAAVATITCSRPCDAIEIGIKSTVWRRIDGFANVNAYPGDNVIEDFEKDGGGFALGSISKYITRYSFFRLQRRKAGTKASWIDVISDEIFAVKGNTPQAQYNYIRIYHDNATLWEYRLKPYPGNAVRRFYVDKQKPVNLFEPGNRITLDSIVYEGRRVALTPDDVYNREWLLGPGTDAEDWRLVYDAIADYVVYDQEGSSHLDNPEHEVTYINELTLNSKAASYADLAIAGIRIQSSKEWSSFDQFSAFIKQGIAVERLVRSGRSATNLFPEIAYALLTDENLGAGSLIGADQVDRDRMRESALFCRANGFRWDGVISERQNLREFIFENAGYCLLDFTIIGGRFSLYPTVPRLSANVKPNIRALFTDGNIRNLQVSFLSPEERQLFKAVCLWRQDIPNGFPQKRTLEINFKGRPDSDPVETFDMSGFCTTEDHARKFAYYALKTRKEVDHGLKFETTPQAAMGLNPGEYFRLVSEATHTSRFNNGSITEDGVVISQNLADGSYPIYFWEPGTTGVRETTLNVTSGKTTQNQLRGTVFTLRNSTTTDRVYKVESISYSEDGLVEISGSHVPLTAAGTLELLNWDPAQFVEVTY